MTIYLPEELEQFIRAEVLAGRYSNEADVVAEAVRRLIGSREGAKPTTHPASAPLPGRRPIWEVAEELGRSIPADEMAKLPREGAAEHDHYIHGTAKRSAS